MTYTRPGLSALAACACMAVVLCWAGAAQAKTPIEAFSAQPSTPQAGGHPDVEVYFSLENRLRQRTRSSCNCEDARDAKVKLPTGFIGNPHAAPQCSLSEFSSDKCAIDSQVGIANVGVSLANTLYFDSAIYNLTPPPDEAGLLGFKIFGSDAPQFIVLSARTDSDYGLDATSTSIYHGSPDFASLRQVLWGVPSDHSHDLLRLDPALNTDTPGLTSYLGNLCAADGSLSTTDPASVVQPCNTDFNFLVPVQSSNGALTPFLQSPTNCDAPLNSTLEVLSYDTEITQADSPWPQMTGCDQLSFNPSLYAQPTTTETDSASGIDVDLEVPQPQSPTVPSPSELRAATVTLPEGFSINPNAADGKVSCADTEARFGTLEEANCPEFATVGSLTIDSSALPAPIPGFVYLGEPQPGNRYRIFLVANGFATHVKLAGTVTPDPQTGQLRIVFTNLPQTPLTAFNMHFFGSERGLLATPTQCGTYPVTSTFTPWDSSLAEQTSTQFFTLESGPFGAPCPAATRPFDPGFDAGSLGHTAGSHDPFWLEFTRPDGDQDLTGVDVTTPPGFLATLRGVTYCSDAAIAAAGLESYSGLAQARTPSCPASSQIGTAMTGAGAGTHPLYVQGKVYLAGPYKGAPLSLVVITPAISGPYDLGSAVVRAALHVDPTTVQITAVSDPLPQILGGVPLRLRSIHIDLDRPDFALNPTNCDPFSVNATIHGDEGGAAARSQHFQVAECRSLPFEPKLSLRLSGASRRTGTPALSAHLTAKPGESNIAKTIVTLPKSELLDNAHIRNVCTRTQFAADACPARSELGFARAQTPLLDRPLEGPVYLRSNPEHELPDIVAALRGQISVDLVGRIDTVNERLRTSFETVPDAPVSDFTLNLSGGDKGLLINSKNLCASKPTAKQVLVGQNGTSMNQSAAPIHTSCGGSKHTKRHRRHAQRRAEGNRETDR